MHIAVAPTSARVARSADLKVHWVNVRSRGVQAIPEAIALAYRCRGAETAFVLLESALHRKLVTRGERALIDSLVPDAFRRWSRLASAESESGTESLMKLLLISHRIPFRQQVGFPGIGRVDFLLGSDLVVEVDGREHHADFTRDRRRDTLLSARGVRSLRFAYSQVVHHREEVEDAIMGAVVRGDVTLARRVVQET